MSLFDRVGAAIVESLQAESARVADEVRDRISVPVVRQGGRTIRSKPGEAPRKDSGRLQASITSDVAQSGDQIDAAISADTPYVRPLNNQLNRPVYGAILESNQRSIVSAMAAAVLTVKE